MTLTAVLARLLLTRCRWLFAFGDARDAEILALRHQVLVLQRQINRPRFTETDRAILALLAVAMDRVRRGRALMIVRLRVPNTHPTRSFGRFEPWQAVRSLRS